ncbi:MAG: hypothetical protein AMJ41_00445 [candidate division Zixibacteria bacterium DG_27]|nr:MAG: hypothetical protein AMJ41_00445 [candidate division Zixibacteria bacterium DG_27]
MNLSPSPEGQLNTKESNLSSDPELTKQFILEVREHLQSLEPNLLKLEEEPDNQEVLNDIFRSMHTIKGASSFLRFERMTEMSHMLENILEKLRRGSLKPNSEIIDVILEGTDLLGELADGLAAGKTSVLERGKLPIDEKLRQIEESFLESGQAGRHGEQPDPKWAQRRDALRKGEKKTTAKRKTATTPEMKAFLQAARQHLDVMKDCLDQMERGQISQASLDNYLRAIHSLRNSASYMKLEPVESLMAKEEKLVEKFRAGEIELSSPVMALLLQTHDFVKGLIESPDEQGAEVEIAQLLTDLARASQGELKPPRLGEILVSQGKVSEEDLQEALQDQRPLGEILIDRKKVTREDVKKALDRQAALRVEKAVTVEDTVRVERSKLDHLLKLAGELTVNRDRFLLLTQKMRSDPEGSEIQDELEKATASLEEISSDLQGTVRKVCMVPLNSVFRRLPRIVRDLARQKGKKIELEILGGTIQVDKVIVDRLADPLLHLVRNAVDHGIESPAVRRELSKSEAGLVTVRAFHEGQNLMIEVEDNGEGMSPVQIRERAVERGMLSSMEAQALDDAQALDLLFAPGFSTAAEVTSLSGRGVGLDVVKRNVRSLNGHITTTTDRHQGTKFSLRLPLTPATVEVLMIETCGNVFALPVTAVEEVLSVKPEQVKSTSGEKVVVTPDQTLKIVELSALLKLPSRGVERNEMQVVVVGEEGSRVGLVVDAIREKEQIAAKPPEGPLARTDGFSGATLSGKGEVVPILNPSDLLKL